MSDFIPDRLNESPSVFKGCSWEELAGLAALAAASSLVLGILAWIVTGIWLLIFCFVTVGTLLGLFFGSIFMQVAKKGRPSGYFKTKWNIALQNLGLVTRTAITQSRIWDIRSE